MRVEMPHQALIALEHYKLHQNVWCFLGAFCWVLLRSPEAGPARRGRAGLVEPGTEQQGPVVKTQISRLTAVEQMQKSSIQYMSIPFNTSTIV